MRPRGGFAKSLARVAPALARQWHPTKNGAATPRDVSAGSQRIVWWRCPRGHEWLSAVRNRVRGARCPYCAGRIASVTTSLAAREPAIARQWDDRRNGDLTPRDVTIRSGKTVWWKCPKGPDHRWQCTVDQRTRGRGCPFCAGKRVSVTNSLARRRPDIAREWHPVRNGKLTPRDVTLGSGRHVWWRCSRGPDHEWRGSVANRNTGFGCPFCGGRRASVTNSLAAREPRFAREWHPTRNGTLTPHNVTFGAGRVVWWKCPFGHEWKQTVNHRTHKQSGCPLCRRRPSLQATTGRRRTPVRFGKYEGVRRGPVRHVR